MNSIGEDDLDETPAEWWSATSGRVTSEFRELRPGFYRVIPERPGLFLWFLLLGAAIVVGAWSTRIFVELPVGGLVVMNLVGLSWMTGTLFWFRKRPLLEVDTASKTIVVEGALAANLDPVRIEQVRAVQICLGDYHRSDPGGWQGYQANLVIERDGQVVRLNVLDAGEPTCVLDFANRLAELIGVRVVGTLPDKAKS